ncbi:MAG: hypothetical protein IT374_20705 [Polyangiaceae bacterium]|nr:hypothetical protein [Polyangiaceae bacterium]
MLGPLFARVAQSFTFYPMLALCLFVVTFVLVTHRALKSPSSEELRSLPLSKEDEP